MTYELTVTVPAHGPGSDVLMSKLVSALKSDADEVREASVRGDGAGGHVVMASFEAMNRGHADRIALIVAGGIVGAGVTKSWR